MDRARTESDERLFPPKLGKSRFRIPVSPQLLRECHAQNERYPTTTKTFPASFLFLVRPHVNGTNRFDEYHRVSFSNRPAESFEAKSNSNVHGLSRLTSTIPYRKTPKIKDCPLSISVCSFAGKTNVVNMEKTPQSDSVNDS